MKLLFTLVSLLSFAPFSLAGEPTALSFADGERFRFRVSWGIFTSAGEITVAADAEQQDGKQFLRIKTDTTTKGFIRTLLMFDGEGDSLFDAHDGRILTVNSSSATSKKKTRSATVFDYDAKIIRYTDQERPERNCEQPLPAGQITDLITCLIQTRSWTIKPGERRPVFVMFEREIYALTVIAEGYEEVKTPWGKIRALILNPIMETEPKGMFKKGGSVRVWISQDEKHLPVKFEVGMKYGTGVAKLTEYTPPPALVTPPPAAPTPTP